MWGRKNDAAADAASQGHADPATQAAAATGPTFGDEIAFISGVDGTGRLAAKSFYTWNYNNPATYSRQSGEYKWGGTSAGTAGGTLTYAFAPSSHWTTAEKAAFVSGLTMWSAVANVSFKLVTSTSAADLTFRRGNDGSAYESSPTSTNPVGSRTISNPGASIISIDTHVNGFGKLGSFTTYGGYGIQVVLHEEGHFLGLGHGGAYNGDINTRTQQFSAYDNRMYSLMSYIDPSDMSAKYAADNPVKGTDWGGQTATTWMPLDIVAIQRLYGVAVQTPLAGGQVFGYHTNITGALKAYFDFTQNTKPVVTLWDKGTDNTLDLSGCTTSCRVNLNPGTYSSFDGMTNNLAIAYHTVIDHAVGGSAADRIIGNRVADTIDGGAGNDTISLHTTPAAIDGGAGTDTLVVLAGGRVALGNARFKNVETIDVQSGALVDLAWVSTAPASIVSQSVAGKGGAMIVGSRGADRIVAGAGGDTIAGGLGWDHIIAGSGADTFDDMMARFGRDTIAKANLARDTFEFSTSFAADSTAAHLHFAAIDGGADTLVYGDRGPKGEGVVLAGVTLATAEAHRSAFHVEAPKAA